MKKLERLKKQAVAACENRGHDMTRFRRDGYWTKCATASCRDCGMAVTVDAKPMANGIDIGGEAVALNCEVRP